MICCHKSKYLVDGAWFANSYLLPHTAAVFTLLLFAASWFIVNKFTLVDANCCIVYEFVLLPNAIKHILCEFKLNCDTRCGFLVGIHIYIFFLLYADAQMQNFAARLCIVCTFAFFVTRWCKVVYVLQIYICLQTLSPVISNNYIFANNAPNVEFFTGCCTLLRYLPVHISCRKLAYCYSHVLMQGWASFANLFVCER